MAFNQGVLLELVYCADAPLFRTYYSPKTPFFKKKKRKNSDVTENKPQCLGTYK